MRAASSSRAALSQPSAPPWEGWAGRWRRARLSATLQVSICGSLRAECLSGANVRAERRSDLLHKQQQLGCCWLSQLVGRPLQHSVWRRRAASGVEGPAGQPTGRCRRVDGIGALAARTGPVRCSRWPAVAQGCSSSGSATMCAGNPALAGTLPAEVSLASGLTFLSLAGSALTGSIPAAVSQLPSLSYLSLVGAARLLPVSKTGSVANVHLCCRPAAGSQGASLAWAT